MRATPPIVRSRSPASVARALARGATLLPAGESAELLTDVLSPGLVI